MITQNLFWIVLLAAFFVSAALGVLVGQKKINPLPNLTEKSQKCPEVFSENPEILSIYITDPWFADALLAELCSNDVVKRQFGNVNITIGGNDFDTFRHINYGITDLALVKQNLVTAFASEQVHGYQAIAKYPDYSAFFIARNEKPLVTKEYLLGKRIGLLDYPSSRSGHIAPKIVLQQLGVSASNAELLYFNSHAELRDKLSIGEVDIISSYWDESDAQRFSENYKTEIGPSVNGAKWFLRQQSRNTDLICALQSTIKSVSAMHPSLYYNGVEIIGQCPRLVSNEVPND